MSPTTSEMHSTALVSVALIFISVGRCSAIHTNLNFRPKAVWQSPLHHIDLCEEHHEP